MSDANPPVVAEQDEFEGDAVPLAKVKTERFHRELKPWHKPRKQIVRHAWRDNVRRLMSELSWPNGTERVLRYFTLPAPEMLDIRALAETARAKEYKVQYVGFTGAQNGSADDAQYQLGQSALRAQEDWVHGASNILYFKLEQLAEGTKPVARTKLKNYGPFHVVNFDLCDYLLAPGANAKLLDALAQILEIQTFKHSDDWLLFIATRFDAANTCPIKFAKLREVIESNCAESADFKAGLEDLLKIGAGTCSQVLSDPAAVSQEKLRDAISVGLTKWIAKMLLQASPPFKLDMMQSYVYAVEGSTQDMLSFVYRCRYHGAAASATAALAAPATATAKEASPTVSTPAPAVSAAAVPAPTSAASGEGPTNESVEKTKGGQAVAVAGASTEIEVALKAIQKTSKLFDLDAHLRDKPEEFTKLGEETKALLREANYSDEELAKYDAWAVAEAAKTVAAVN